MTNTMDYLQMQFCMKFNYFLNHYINIYMEKYGEITLKDG